MKENDRILTLQRKSRGLPVMPGCYLMKNKEGRILYVGKAKNLRQRVSSYFFKGQQHGAKTQYLVSLIEDFDFILTSGEADAFVLENNLIKQHTPKYNIRLKDDKSYPYLIVDFSMPFPRLEYTRKIHGVKFEDGVSEIYGPFIYGQEFSEVLRILNKVYQLRDCSEREYALRCGRKEACLLYQMHQCAAPCIDKISKDDYLLRLKNALQFFTHQATERLEDLHSMMMEAAEREEFERAIQIRDSLEVLQRFIQRDQQKNIELFDEEKSFDVLATYTSTESKEVDLCLTLVRQGVVRGQKNFYFSQEFNFSEQLGAVLTPYYEMWPKELWPKVVYFETSGQECEWLNQYFKGAIKFRPIAGAGKVVTSLSLLAWQNAKEYQKQRQDFGLSRYAGLEELQRLLHLKERPSTLECFDVAIWQGQSPTASCVAFEDGRAQKKRYRYYTLEIRPEGNNDFEMLKEALLRRLKSPPYPDVFIFDGGFAQLNCVYDVLRAFFSPEDFKLLPFGVVALAKAKAPEKEERLMILGRKDPVELKRMKALFPLLVQMRDEAHRFCRRLHHLHEKQRTLGSHLDGLQGVGPKIKKRILKKLSCSWEEVGSWPVYKIMEEFSLNLKMAKALKNYLAP